MAALIILGYSRWPGVFLGALLLDYGHYDSLSLAVNGAFGATFQALAGTWLLHRFRINRTLNRLQDAIGFVGLSVVLAAMINATLFIAFLGLTESLAGATLWKKWATFCLGDGMGILTITPLLMVLNQPRRPDRKKSASATMTMEIGAWLLLLVLSSWLVFHHSLPPQLVPYPLEYIPAALLVWAMLRFGQLTSVIGSSGIAAIAIAGFVQGEGIFVDRAPPTSSFDLTAIWLLQTFMAVVGTTTLIVSTAVREQRTTQALLKKRDASLRNAQQIAQLGHWEYDLQTHQWLASSDLKQLLGFSDHTPETNVETLDRETLLTCILEADRDRVHQAYTQAIFTRQPYSLQYGMVRPDGHLRYMVEQVAIRDGCLMGVIQDVTERVQAEQALRDSEEKFSKAFGFSPDAITISTLDEGRFIDINDSFLRLSGYQRHDVIGHTVVELELWSNPGDRQWLTDQLQHHKSVRNKECAFRTKSGETVFALVSAEIITIHAQRYLLIVARDITEQKRADEQLRLAVERDRLLGNLALHIRQTLDLNNILETTVDEVRLFLQVSRVFIGRFDESGRGEVVAEAVQPEFSSLMGESMDEGVHHDVCQVFKHMPVVAIDDMVNLDQFPCLSFLEECVERYQVRASLGVPILVNDSLYGILVAHSCDTPRHWTSFEKELLEQLAIQVAIAIQQGELYAQVQALNAGLEYQVKERTQQLESSMKELQDLNQLKDVLLHAVSHDLLTTVRGNLMVLESFKNQPQDPVQIQRHCLDRMISAGNQQLSKLTALQEAYTFKTQGIHLDRSVIAPYPLMQAAIDDQMPLMTDNQSTITIDCSCEDAQLSADRTLLMRVFKHLISNAVIHNPPKTSIHVHMHGDHQHLICSVADDGIGVPEQMRDRLFQLCLGTPQNPQLKGISLGLYFCQQVIHAHGGHISISSVPDQGTAVTIVLPMLSESSQATLVEEGEAQKVLPVRKG
jgi:PAS domain S-box-containing protein